MHSIASISSVQSTSANNLAYRTPSFSAASQMEDQQKQLISGFEGIELNNQNSQMNFQESQQQFD